MDESLPLMRKPAPRPSIANPALVRPDWIAGQPRNASMLWLDKNENLDPELASFVSGIIRTLGPEVVSVYPDVGPLYQQLAASLGCGANQLMLTAGSDAAIASVFQAFVAPGDKVIHTSPTFAMYNVYSQIFGAEVFPLEYQPSASGPQFDLERALDLITRLSARLICLPNPDSPTGTVLRQADLRQLIGAAGAVGAIVVVDEAYFPFYPHSAVDLTKIYENLVVIRSASKNWGLAGLRVGFAVAAPSLAMILHKVKPMYEIGNFAATVYARLIEDEGRMLASVRRLLAGKAAFIAAMDRFGFKTLKTEGNFLHVAFGPKSEQVHQVLADLVYYRREVDHPSLRGFSRFSATTVEGFQPVIDRIRTVV